MIHRVWAVDGGYGNLRENSDIPFCLFLTLARLFNRAPSTGANGCRARVAMAEKGGVVSLLNGGVDAVLDRSRSELRAAQLLFA